MDKKRDVFLWNVFLISNPISYHDVARTNSYEHLPFRLLIMKMHSKVLVLEESNLIYNIQRTITI